MCFPPKQSENVTSLCSDDFSEQFGCQTVGVWKRDLQDQGANVVVVFARASKAALPLLSIRSHSLESPAGTDVYRSSVY